MDIEGADLSGKTERRKEGGCPSSDRHNALRREIRIMLPYFHKVKDLPGIERNYFKFKFAA